MSTPYGKAAPAMVADRRTDSQLVADSARDSEALATLYQRYAPRVYWFLRARVGSSEDAADLSQQVFLRAIQALPQYRDRGVSFSAWLFRIARNIAVDFHRARRVTVPWDEISDYYVEPRYATAPQVTSDDHRLYELDSFLAQLTSEQRELLALRFSACLTISEVAAVLGKSEAATGKRIQRLVRNLKEAYKRA